MKNLNIRRVLSLMTICGGALLWPAASCLADEPPQNDAKTATIEELQAGVADIAEGGDGKVAPLDPTKQEAEEAEEAEAMTEGEKPKKRLYFPSLGTQLREIEGVQKVNHVDAVNGMKCIFAFFEDKDAAKRWYYSDLHQGILDRFHPNRLRDREPMFKVPDDVGPMMGLACFTPPKGPGQPITQIAIELFKPLHGGFSRGGRFSPDEWKDTFEHYDQYYEEHSEKVEDKPSQKALKAAEGAAEGAMNAAEEAVEDAVEDAADEAIEKAKKAVDQSLE